MKLGDVVTINSTTVKKNYPFETICYFDISSVGEGFIREIEEIDLETAPSRARRIIKNGDTIISTVRPENRTFYFCKNVRDNSIASTGFAVLTPFKNLINERYLYYFISQREFTSYLVNHQKGSTYPAITVDVIENKNIDLPNLDVQKKIARILSAYDDLIENNLKRINLLEQAAQNIYKEWFVNMRFPGHENAEFDSKTGLPEGWENKLLGDILRKLESGKRPKGGIDKSLGVGIPSIGAESVRGLGYFDYSKTKFISEEFYSSMKKGKLENKDILIYKDGAYIGRTTLFQDDFPFSRCAINEHIFLIHADENQFQYYLYFVLHSDVYFEKMQNLNSNSAQPGINQQKLKTLEIVVPSKDLIVDFDQLATPLICQIHSLSKMNYELKQARDILHPRLMNQTIEV